MTGDPPPVSLDAAPASPFATVPPRRRTGRVLALVAVLGFAIGVVAMFYLLPVIQRWRASSAPVATVPAQPTQPSSPPVRANPVVLDTLTARSAALDTQLREIEGRMAAADAASRTASGYARRAEGLMVAFAARRALERGLALGYVEAQLRERFGADQPAAVGTVIAASKNPLTLADLREGLTRIAPTLTSGSAREGFLTSAWNEISTLVILRRDESPSPRPDARLQRARTILDGGNVEGALAEVVRMPGATDASSWIDAAKRYIDSRRALNVLEAAALRTPDPQPQPATPVPNPAGMLPGA